MRYIVLLACCISTTPLYAQISHVISWRPDNSAGRTDVYHPEPVLFIHGINDNDATWGEVAIPVLKDVFSLYDLPILASNSFVGIKTNLNLNSRQEAYLHTFNYGDYPKSPLGMNPQSFEHIEWNAWEADMQTKQFVNPLLKGGATHRTIRQWQSYGTLMIGGQFVDVEVEEPPDGDHFHAPPNDQRMTLEARIHGRRTFPWDSRRISGGSQQSRCQTEPRDRCPFDGWVIVALLPL